MKIIFILSMWRSGTSWLESMLGKNVENSALFGHEQQILPLLTMYKESFNDHSLTVRRRANTPLCDITKSDFHKELGLKQHKILLNAQKYSGENFNSFALRLMDFLLFPYMQNNLLQVVEKTPTNLSPECFKTAIDIFQNKNNYELVYLIRNYRPYLSSCYQKFVKKNINSLEYYSDKWIAWNNHALRYLKNKSISNLSLVKYEDLVYNPGIIKNFCIAQKENIKIRENTLSKWEKSPIVSQIQNMYDNNFDEINKIKNTFSEYEKINIESDY